MGEQELLTAKKVAERLGLPPKRVAEFIKAQGIAPDRKKGPCAYYGPATVKRIQKGCAP